MADLYKQYATDARSSGRSLAPKHKDDLHLGDPAAEKQAQLRASASKEDAESKEVTPRTMQAIIDEDKKKLKSPPKRGPPTKPLRNKPVLIDEPTGADEPQGLFQMVTCGMCSK